MDTAVVTGASRGLGLAVARALAERGWRLVIDARGADELSAAQTELSALTEVISLAGDVGDEWHRSALVAEAGERIDLLVNNASSLGPSPLPALAELSPAAFEEVLRVNLLAPLALVQRALPLMPAGGRILNVSSDAAVEPYEGWGGYGASKAALEQLTRVLAAERPDLRIYAVDPGRHAHPHAPGRLPGRGHLRSPAPGGERARTARAGRGRPAERPLRGSRAGRGARVSLALAQPREAGSPAEERGSGREDVRLLVARGTG